MLNSVERNVLVVKRKIEIACKTYGKRVSDVNIVAISKKVSSEKIIEAINCGCQIFGENYISEAKEKWPKIKNLYPQTRLHFVGNLQSNKAKEAVELFDVIESLDSENAAKSLAKEIVKQQKNPEIYIQINIGEELQKGGILPQNLAKFLHFCCNGLGLKISGLMCIPPSQEAASPYFALLAKMARENNLPNISMGMSSDFEEAIALGANYIRIGTAIFGNRASNN